MHKHILEMARAISAYVEFHSHHRSCSRERTLHYVLKIIITSGEFLFNIMALAYAIVSIWNHCMHISDRIVFITSGTPLQSVINNPACGAETFAVALAPPADRPHRARTIFKGIHCVTLSRDFLFLNRPTITHFLSWRPVVVCVWEASSSSSPPLTE